MTLSSCSPLRAPADFCAKLGRKLTDQERIRDTLVKILSNRAALERNVGKGQIQFFTFYDERKQSNATLSDAAIANQYQAAFPNCCFVAAPSFLKNPGLAEENDGVQDWAAEVYIWKNASPVGLKTRDRIGRIVSPCDDYITYERGLNAVLE